MKVLQEAGLPFLVVGAYALAHHTGIRRQTKDFDIVLRARDVRAALEALSEAGFETELTSEVWLAKAFWEGELVDLIFNSGNALSPVDDSWFERASRGTLLGMEVLICPVEEIIWTKAFIMERERYDGADIMHLIRGCGEQIDWSHLLNRFGEHYRVLLSHLVLFGFIYPSHRDKIPAEVMTELLERVADEVDAPQAEINVCRGTLLSRTQYLVDVDRWGCKDGRVSPHGTLTQDEADELSLRRK